MKNEKDFLKEASSERKEEKDSLKKTPSERNEEKDLLKENAADVSVDQKPPKPRNEGTSPQIPWYAMPQERPEATLPKAEYTLRDALVSWIVLALSYFFVRVFPVHEYPLGGTLALLLLFAVGGLYLRLSGHRPHRRSLLIAPLCALLSLGTMLNGNAFLQHLTLAVLLCGFACWSYDVCGLAGKRLSSDALSSHAVRAILQFPFLSLTALFPSLAFPLRRSAAAKRLWRTLGWIALGLCIAVIPTLIIVLLLSYDAQFEGMLNRIFSFSPETLFRTLGDLLFSIPIAMLLFGTLFSLSRRAKKTDSAEEAPLPFGRYRIVPAPLFCAAITPILLVYVLFFISQWSYYVSAFTRVLPAGMTYAQYAREGFFQLFTVSLINALLLLALHLLLRSPADGKHRLRRVYSALLSLFTLILIATALSKMILYIGTYGLTQKRVYASVMMLFLAVLFLCVLIRQILRRFPSAAVTLATGALLLALLSLSNPDALIASYNVDAYLRGDLKSVDVEALEDLGDSAIPAMARLESVWIERESAQGLPRHEREALSRLTEALDLRAEELSTDTASFLSFSVPTARAKSVLHAREE